MSPSAQCRCLAAPRDQIPLLRGTGQACANVGGDGQRVKHGLGHRHVAKPDAHPLEAGGAERLPQQQHRFGVGFGSVGADELGTGLTVLGRHGLARLGNAEARPCIGDADRSRVIGQAGRDQSRDRNREVGAEHEDPSGLVKQAKGAVKTAAIGALKLLGELHDGCPDFAIAVPGEGSAQRVLDRA